MKNQSLLKSRTFYVALALLGVLFIIDGSLGVTAIKSATFQFVSMLKIVPPIFLMIGLLDVWVPRETMIKLMGENSGIRGVGIAFFLGTLTAGPLVAAFPVAMIMLKKGAKYSNVLFFLMVWASAKLPILFFQVTTLGLAYTVVTNVTLLTVYLVGTVVIEKMLTHEETRQIYELAENA